MGIKIDDEGEIVGHVGTMEYIDIERLLVAIAYAPTVEPDWPVKQLEPLVFNRSFPAACCLLGQTWTAYVHAHKRIESIWVDLVLDNRRLVRLLLEPQAAHQGVTAILKAIDY